MDEKSRSEFGATTEMLARHEATGEEGNFQATLAKMNEDEAKALAT